MAINGSDPGGVDVREVDAWKVSINDVQLQTSADPNSQVAWSFVLSNETDVNYLMPEWCDHSGLIGSGTHFNVTVTVAGDTVHSETRCVPDEGAASADMATFNGTFFTPSATGTYDVEFRVVTVPTGQTVAEQRFTLDVFEDSPSPGGCPSGFVWDAEQGQCVRADGGPGDGGGGGDLLRTVIENPVKTAGVAVGVGFVVDRLLN